jgi:tRNA (cytidine/uridine-2'-O-)-methyltransferase
MFTVVLIEPQIPPNTGNIARLCAATDTTLHLVGNLGFSLSDKHLKRAGLDYWQYLEWEHFPSVEAYFEKSDSSSLFLLTTKSEIPYTHKIFKKGDKLIFGSETTGINKKYLERYHDQCCTIPMKRKTDGARSLNLSTSVGIVLYEAIRQVES